MARRSVKAAQADYIPDVTAFVQHVYQSGAPCLVHNNGVAGFKLEWNAFGFCKRRHTVSAQQAAVDEAEENLEHVRNRVAIEVNKSYRKLERAKQMIEVAREALALRQESERLSAERVKAGVLLPASYKESQAAVAGGEADTLQAELNYRLATAELDRAIGRSH
jgi:outer membrane protein TolC